MSDDEASYGLVMPFVACTSKGGPFDDAAYVAGFEMGRLDEELRSAGHCLNGGTTTIHAGNAEQADLICMRHGFTATVELSGTEGWSYLTFKAAGDDT